MKARWLLVALPILVLIAGLLYVHVGRHGRLPEDELVVWSNPAVTGPSIGPVLLGRYYDSSLDGFRPAVRPLATLFLRLEWLVFRTDRAGFSWVEVVLLGLAGFWLFLLLRRELGSMVAAALGSVLCVVHPLACASVLGVAGTSDLLALNLVLVAFLLGRRSRFLSPPGKGPAVGAAVALLLALLSKEAAFAFVPAFWVWLWARARGATLPANPGDSGLPEQEGARSYFPDPGSPTVAEDTGLSEREGVWQDRAGGDVPTMAEGAGLPDEEGVWPDRAGGDVPPMAEDTGLPEGENAWRDRAGGDVPTMAEDAGLPDEEGVWPDRTGRVVPPLAQKPGLAESGSFLSFLFLGSLAALVVVLIHREAAFLALPQNLKIARAVGAATGMSWLRRSVVGLSSVVLFLKLLVLPLGLAYSHDEIGVGGAPVLSALAGAIILVLLGVFLVRWARKGSPLALWAALTFFPLFGATGIIGAGGEFPSERLFFMALPGAIGLIAAGYLSLRRFRNLRLDLAVTAVVLLIAVALSVRTSLRLPDYQEWDTLVSDQTANHPRSVVGHYDLGNVYLIEGQWDNALAQYQEAVKLNPDFWMAWVNMGTAYFSNSEPGLAVRSFERTMAGTRGRPEFTTVEARAEFNRALVLMQQNRNDEAVSGFIRMLQVFPDHLAAHANLGFIYSNNSRFDDLALQHLGRALELETNPERKKSLEAFIGKVSQRREAQEKEQHKGASAGSPAPSASPEAPPAGGSKPR